ncbi:hypothetical protein [Sphingobacterium siyangense]|uniref:hypothetical protein n=1 Tax=Sphingobacterium siyangense TaxID=459529 RepID=UPI0031F9E6BD
MDTTVKEQDLIKQGAMQSDFFQMSDTEKNNWRNTIAAKTRAVLFAKGQPLVYEKEGSMVAEYADGTLIKL